MRLALTLAFAAFAALELCEAKEPLEVSVPVTSTKHASKAHASKSSHPKATHVVKPWGPLDDESHFDGYDHDAYAETLSARNDVGSNAANLENEIYDEDELTGYEEYYFDEAADGIHAPSEPYDGPIYPMDGSPLQAREAEAYAEPEFDHERPFDEERIRSRSDDVILEPIEDPSEDYDSYPAWFDGDDGYMDDEHEDEEIIGKTKRGLPSWKKIKEKIR